jgi:hypothetical protein
MLRMLPLLLCSAAALAQDAGIERARIDDERRQVEARYAAEEADCRQRFFVTSCVDQAKARRREGLDILLQQELQLDDAERRRRAADRLQAIEARRAEMAARPPAASQPEPLIRVPSPAPAASAPAEVAPRRRGASASEAEAAASRAAAAERRRAEAAAKQARIAEREAERASGGQRSAPLPPRPEIQP